jgi:uncharacterized OB-fold protein
MSQTAEPTHTVDEQGVFIAPLRLEYPYARTVGSTISRFFTGLRERRIEGARAPDGRVLVPPPDFDPKTGAPLDDWVTVSDEGTVTAWSWVPEPLAGQPLDHPFAWALIRLDGADSTLLHAVDAGSPDRIATGARVRARWSAEPEGAMTDLACFEVVQSR